MNRLDGLNSKARMAAVRCWIVGWAVNVQNFKRSSGKDQGAHIARVMSLSGDFDVPFHVEIAAALHDYLEYSAEQDVDARAEMYRRLERYARELGDVYIQGLDSLSFPANQLDLTDLFATSVVQLVELVTEPRTPESTWLQRKTVIENRLLENPERRDLACLLLLLKTEGLMEAVGVLSKGKPLSSWSKGSYDENMGHYSRLAALFNQFAVPEDLLQLYHHYLLRFQELAKEQSGTQLDLGMED